jgi:hypothetical protein
MTESTVGGAARGVNEEPGASAGEIPLEGRFSAERWAKCFGKSPRTIREWVATYQIRHKKFGDTMYIDAADMWSAVPYHEDGES